MVYNGPCCGLVALLVDCLECCFNVRHLSLQNGQLLVDLRNPVACAHICVVLRCISLVRWITP